MGSLMCAALASALGAAHVSPTAVLKRECASAPSPRDAQLTTALSAGKLWSGQPAIRAIEAALHSSPEALVLVEHNGMCPLDALVTRLRPHLVLLLRPQADEERRAAGGKSCGAGGGGAGGGAGGGRAAGGARAPSPPRISQSSAGNLAHRPSSPSNPGSVPWSALRGPSRATSAGEVARSIETLGQGCSRSPEARLAYELRVLQAMGEEAPPVRVCRGGVVEACDLITDVLQREDGFDDDANGGDSDEEEDDVLLATPHRVGASRSG